ncbi:MAG: hypothetical protein GY720_16635 [bacterium]|nr:hypothetical protein [bacterium]
MSSRGFEARGRLSVLLVALATALIFIPGVPAAASTTHEVTCPGESLQAAIDAASPGDLILLDGVCDENVVVDKDLDIDGKTVAIIDGGGRDSVMRIAHGAAVQLFGLFLENGAALRGGGLFVGEDAHVFASSLFVRDNAASLSGGGVYVDSGGVLSGDGIVVSDNRAESGGGGFLLRNASLAASEVSVERNWARTNGGGVLAFVSNIDISDSHIRLNTTDYNGAGIYLASSSLQMSDSDVDFNTSIWNGGGILGLQSSLDIVQSGFVGNVASSGGALAVVIDSSLSLSDGRFTDNTAAEFGGGLFVTRSDASVTDSDFIQNSAGQAGGGAFSSSVLNVVGGSFEGNQAGRDGGAIATGSTDPDSASNAALDVSLARMISNESGDGGGLSLRTGARGNLVGVSFDENEARRGGAMSAGAGTDLAATGLWASGNYADTYGGVAWIGSGSMSLDDSNFNHNYARDGAAIAVDGGAFLGVAESSLNDNWASYNGGAIHSIDSTLEVSGSVLNANYSRSGGAIASVAESRSTFVDTAMSYNNAEDYGGAIFNVSSEFLLENSSVVDNGSGVTGGGIENRFGAQGSSSMALINSTVASNFAWEGAGIHNLNGTLRLDHATITENELGPALFESTFASKAIVINSIIAGNADGDCAAAAFTSGGGNVLGPDCDVASAQSTDALGIVDPQLSFWLPIGAVMGWYVPDVGSPAVDRVPVGDCSQLVDQVGSVRPLGAGCDSGSIEAEASGPDTIPPIVDADFTHGDAFPPGTVPLSGSASDNVGVEWIGVAIQRLDTKKWLQDDGVSWGDFNRFDADLSNPGSATTDWTFSIALPDNRYVLSALARDAAGNDGRIVPWRLFVVEGDGLPPTVDADFTHNADLPVGSALTGTAADNVGATWVGIAIQDLATHQWLQDDMVSWGNFNRMPASLSSPGAELTDWSLAVDLPVGHYVLSARAKDAAGNSGYIVPWRGFYIAAGPAPAWQILVLVYEHTDFEFNDGGVDRHLVAQMTPTELARAERLATDFFEIDVPALTSGVLDPAVTVRFPSRALGDLDAFCGRFAGPTAIGTDADPDFDSVFTIWDSTGFDVLVGQPLQVARCGGLAYHRGAGQTFATVPVGFTTNAQRNIFKHEWGHSILFYHAAAGNTPIPAVDNHMGVGNVYVHCGTGEEYIWQDETLANPIPNSIYNNQIGFTHDYYSGTTARPESPDTCLGIGPAAWAAGGPVTKP